jgi:hypothetical protein
MHDEPENGSVSQEATVAVDLPFLSSLFGRSVKSSQFARRPNMTMLLPCPSSWLLVRVESVVWPAAKGYLLSS